VRNCIIVSKQSTDFLIPFLASVVGSRGELFGKWECTFPSPSLLNVLWTPSVSPISQF